MLSSMELVSSTRDEEGTPSSPVPCFCVLLVKYHCIAFSTESKYVAMGEMKTV
jgi:hypothetical protein